MDVVTNTTAERECCVRRAAIPPPVSRSAHTLTTHLLALTYPPLHPSGGSTPSSSDTSKWIASPSVGLEKRLLLFPNITVNMAFAFRDFHMN